MAIKQGDRFRLTRNYRGHGAVVFDGAADEELPCVLEKDTVLVAKQDVDAMATGFMCFLESPEVVGRIVPPESRAREDYAGCRFVFYTGDLGALLEAL